MAVKVSPFGLIATNWEAEMDAKLTGVLFGLNEIGPRVEHCVSQGLVAEDVLTNGRSHAALAVTHPRSVTEKTISLDRG